MNPQFGSQQYLMQASSHGSIAGSVGSPPISPSQSMKSLPIQQQQQFVINKVGMPYQSLIDPRIDMQHAAARTDKSEMNVGDTRCDTCQIGYIFKYHQASVTRLIILLSIVLFPLGMIMWCFRGLLARNECSMCDSVQERSYSYFYIILIFLGMLTPGYWGGIILVLFSYY